MQFVEKNSFSVRSAVYEIQAVDSEIEFVLFPMVHIGTANYYQQIAKRISRCDLILVEGVHSKRANVLTFSYRIIKSIKRMDLVTQQDALDMATLKNKVVNIDMKGERLTRVGKRNLSGSDYQSFSLCHSM